MNNEYIKYRFNISTAILSEILRKTQLFTLEIAHALATHNVLGQIYCKRVPLSLLGGRNHPWWK